ncbi:hypothetical protein HPB50_006616 [Hyalomma asiaticum]|uniref:Uncharacterized protein n=1 Tax=Hyalomma asiaticum TaxID=266040 RepID=A0ACB7S5J9_HYAAI|nr:hypothetical protein HPB50_006616 [Hyalomma asiaticum]
MAVGRIALAAAGHCGLLWALSNPLSGPAPATPQWPLDPADGGVTYLKILPTREEQLLKLRTTLEFDILVLGGGAIACGVALDAATRGLHVALCDIERGTHGLHTRHGKNGIRAYCNAKRGVREQRGTCLLAGRSPLRQTAQHGTRGNQKALKALAAVREKRFTSGDCLRPPTPNIARTCHLFEAQAEPLDRADDTELRLMVQLDEENNNAVTVDARASRLPGHQMEGRNKAGITAAKEGRDKGRHGENSSTFQKYI